MTPEEFGRKWRGVTRSERSAAQEHFLDLCALLGVPKPADIDPHGTEYTFEKTTRRIGDRPGYADVWKKGCFAWEYKRDRRNLVDAYAQLKQYADALENPPLLIVSDMEEIRIHTNFTNTIAQTHVIELRDLPDPKKRELLRDCFQHPDRLLPTETREGVTAKAASEFARIALELRRRHDERRVAHFVNKLVFCLFAEDIELLPNRVFASILEEGVKHPENFDRTLRQLFSAMADRGGMFGAVTIPWFNGGLFDDDDVLPLGGLERELRSAARLDWKAIDPTIFGTLFEGGLDDKRRAEMASLFDTPEPEHQPQFLPLAAPAANRGVGIHYTDEATIMKIIEPVVVAPLRREWEQVKHEIRALDDRRHRAQSPAATNSSPPAPPDGRPLRAVPGVSRGSTSLQPTVAATEDVDARNKSGQGARGKRRPLPENPARLVEQVRALYAEFRASLGRYRVLDPACGSGNFLALSLRALKDFDLAVLDDAKALGLPPDDLKVGPEAVMGIEINGYAAELARLTVWITELQWQLRNDFGVHRRPILDRLDGIQRSDALVTNAGRDAEWPEADAVVGNPPFLGRARLRQTLGDAYVERLFAGFAGRVPAEADLVAYWFAKAFERMRDGKLTRAGLVATQAIRRGANRRVLDSIAETAIIYDVWADEPWALDGAAVRVSLVCFGVEGVGASRLDGKPVPQIHSDLSAGGSDLTSARRLTENLGICFQGPVKVGAFDVSGAQARAWLRLPLNPNGHSNADVLRPWVNGRDLTGRSADMWIIDFGEMSEREAVLYEAPFEYLRTAVKRFRDSNNRERRRRLWWQHGETVPGLRARVLGLLRVIVTPRVSKHRCFVWVATQVLPDSRVNAVARDDDCAFGILHSRFHETWSVKLGGWHGVGHDPQYTPRMGFETFPFPEGLTPNIPAADYANDPRAIAIAEAARRLNELREAWLNPPDLIDRVPDVAPGYPDRILPKTPEAAEILKKRTLTNLYNQRPAWLGHAHRDLDEAVAAAYGWPADLPEDEALARLLALNLERAAAGR